MPEYLPLGAFRQGLLPGDCCSCAWWQTTGRTITNEEPQPPRGVMSG